MNLAKCAFYYMLSLVTLFITTISFGTVLFEIIDKFFPDSLEAFYYSDTVLKSAFSSILIAAPVFYFIMNRIYANLKSGEFDKDAGVRKWMIYFILFVSSIIVISSLIGILNSFLSGALTTSFILKVLSILFIAVLVFGFYFYDIKRQDFEKGKVNRLFFIFSLILIIFSLVSSLLMIESPKEARGRKLDENILRDFNNIKFAIDDYYNSNEVLPVSLKELRPVKYLEISDYDYGIVEDGVYKLCAEFSLSNLDKSRSYLDEDWKHDKGYYCIQKEVMTYIIKR